MDTKDLMSDEWNKKEEKRERESAQNDILELKAMKVLLRSNTLVCDVRVAGLSVGLTCNKRMIPIINLEIKEIEKFLKEEKNNWE